MAIIIRFLETLEAQTVKPRCPLGRTNTPSNAVFAPKGPFLNTKALDFSAQACNVANARFDPAPRYSKRPQANRFLHNYLTQDLQKYSSEYLLHTSFNQYKTDHLQGVKVTT